MKVKEKKIQKTHCLLLLGDFHFAVHEPFQPFLLLTMQLVHAYKNYEVNSFTANYLVVFS